MSNLINLKKVEKGNGPDFVQELAGVPDNLNESNIESFYSTISDIFQRNEASEASLVRILIALYKVISNANENFLNVYIDNNFVLDLPFESKSKSIQTQLLNVLYALSTHAPLVFNSEVSEKIDNYLIREYPKKTLTIIGIYACQFDSLEDPWPLLDLLVKNHSSYFRRDIDCCQDYVSLLVYLCQEFEDYRSTRIQYCWNSICQCLNTENEPTLTTCYNSLCQIYELDPEVISELSFPIFACSIHLRKKQDVSHSVLSLLFRYQPNFDSSDNSKYSTRNRSMSSPSSPKTPTSSSIMDLVQSLIEVSQTDVNANLILVKMAMNENISRLLLHNATWMTKDMPSKIDTIRLFAVVLSHEDLRTDIMYKAETIDFLRSICTIDASSVLTAICIFIRRLPIDQEYVETLSNSEFLTQFFATAFQHDDETTLHAALVMADTISKVCYVRELLDISDKIVDLAKGENDLALTAGKVAVQMCKYPKCVLRFKRKKLDEYYSNRVRNQNFRKIAVHFLKAFKAAQSEIETNQSLYRSLPAKRKTSTSNLSGSEDATLSPPVTPKLNNTTMANSTKNAKPKNLV